MPLPYTFLPQSFSIRDQPIPLPINLCYKLVLFIFHIKWIPHALPKVLLIGKFHLLHFRPPWWKLYSSDEDKLLVCWYYPLGFLPGWKCMPINTSFQLYILLTSTFHHLQNPIAYILSHWLSVCTWCLRSKATLGYSPFPSLAGLVVLYVG